MILVQVYCVLYLFFAAHISVVVLSNEVNGVSIGTAHSNIDGEDGKLGYNNKIEVETRLLSEVSEQQRIDTIVRAFGKLPFEEIEVMGIDLSTPILPGSQRAKELEIAWANRQKELKEAMASIIKPAEHMAELTQKLTFENSTEDDISHILLELESMVADIDNARDFHTIGGWPILTSFLSDKPIPHRSLAAWVIGTAVKNSYDFQLWLLEPINLNSSYNNETTTALNLLINEFSLSIQEGSPEFHELQRRVLYALSSASRGNTDVQEVLCGKNFDDILFQFATSNATIIDVSRKVWALVADMLEERSYIRGELSDSLSSNPIELHQIEQLKLLGDKICTLDWAIATSTKLSQLVDLPKLHGPPDSKTAPLRATIESLLATCGEFLSIERSGLLELSDLREVIVAQIRQLFELSGDANVDIVAKATQILSSL